MTSASRTVLCAKSMRLLQMNKRRRSRLLADYYHGNQNFVWFTGKKKNYLKKKWYQWVRNCCWERTTLVLFFCIARKNAANFVENLKTRDNKEELKCVSDVFDCGNRKLFVFEWASKSYLLVRDLA